MELSRVLACDGLNRQTKTTADPGGVNIVNTYTYDLLGNVLSVTDGENKTTAYTYDTESRLASVTQANGGQALLTRYIYDNMGLSPGRITNAVINAGNQTTYTEFDALGRKRADVSHGLVTSDATKMQTVYDSYDALNRPTVVTRNDGSKVKYTYDSMGRVLREDYYAAGQGTGAPSGDYIARTFNADGKVATERTGYSGGAMTELTTYHYYKNGSLRSYTHCFCAYSHRRILLA